MTKPNWIKEGEAARMLGYTDLDHFRDLVKKNVFNVAYTSTRGRNFQYNKNDIDRLLIENSTFKKTA